MTGSEDGIVRLWDSAELCEGTARTGTEGTARTGAVACSASGQASEHTALGAHMSSEHACLSCLVRAVSVLRHLHWGMQCLRYRAATLAS